MYHDQYTRRRTADSFHDPDEDDSHMGKKIQDDWSWRFFVGFIIVQVTARSVCVSFGVILSFIVKDGQNFWGFFWTPILHTIIWLTSEPWIKKICERINTPMELMYIVVIGLTTSWLGLIIATKCPLISSHLIPLLGVAGGLGTSFAITGSIALQKKHFPNRSGALRSFNHSVAALSVFVMPILSFIIMDNFGDHGGLLIHGGMLMQGLVGGILLKNANWPKKKNKLNGEIYSIVDQTPERWTEPDLKEDLSELESHFWRNPATEFPKPMSLDGSSLQTNSEKPSRQRIFPVKQKKCNAFGVEIMPSILEVSESVNEEDEQDCSDLKKSLEELYKLSCDIIENRQKVNALKKPPRTFEHYSQKTGEETNLKVNEERTSNESDKSDKNDNVEVRVVVDDSIETGKLEEKTKAELDSETGERKQTESGSSLNGIIVEGTENEERTEIPNPSTTDRNKFLDLLRDLRSFLSYLWFYIRHVLIRVPKSNLYLTEPLLLPAVILSYTIQFSFIGFISITPTLIIKYIEDSTEEESAFTVCLAGFTWLCFVIASPCFSTIHFTNHQFICVAALVSSSFSCYMLSESTTQDETALYSSLYGISHGITLMTSYSVLKMSFHGSNQLQEMQPCINTMIAILMALSTYLISITPWMNDLRNCFKIFAVMQGLSAFIWTAAGCVVSVRARRSHLHITWSRRRRVS